MLLFTANLSSFLRNTFMSKVVFCSSARILKVASILIRKFHVDLALKSKCRVWLHMIRCTVYSRMMLIKLTPFPSFWVELKSSNWSKYYLLCVLDFLHMFVSCKHCTFLNFQLYRTIKQFLMWDKYCLP